MRQDISFKNSIILHYTSVWDGDCSELKLNEGAMFKEIPNFSILEFPPTHNRKHWIYATKGMSCFRAEKIELHLFSKRQDVDLIKLLTVIAYYHYSSKDKIGLNHTVNFGQGWQLSSICTFGLISLPYPYGPDLENFEYCGVIIKCYWLIPITLQERNFKIENGIDSLENMFEKSNVDLLDPFRKSIL